MTRNFFSHAHALIGERIIWVALAAVLLGGLLGLVEIGFGLATAVRAGARSGSRSLFPLARDFNLFSRC